jgi:hypothetical protein
MLQVKVRSGIGKYGEESIVHHEWRSEDDALDPVVPPISESRVDTPVMYDVQHRIRDKVHLSMPERDCLDSFTELIARDNRLAIIIIRIFTRPPR